MNKKWIYLLTGAILFCAGLWSGIYISKHPRPEIITIYQSKDTTHWKRDDLGEDSTLTNKSK